MHRTLAVFGAGLTLGAALGFGFGAVPRHLDPAPSVPAPTEPAPAPLVAPSPIEPAVPPPAPVPPDTMAALLKANQLGCDCPLPPPEDVDPVYLPAGVEAWLDQLERDCPVFAERETTVDCSEWPCMLTVSFSDRGEWRNEALVAFLTCGISGPNLVPKGNVGSPESGFSHLFSIRPSERREYSKREFVRSNSP